MGRLKTSNRSCQICGTTFEGNAHSKYCPPCAKKRNTENQDKWYDLYRKKKEAPVQICAVCDKEFYCPPSQKKNRKTCSPACRTAHRKGLHENGNYKHVEPARLEGLHKSPKTGHYESHTHAKSWKLKSPTGEVYECRNLRLWVDEHPELFDGTPDQAYRGLVLAKAILTGKRKRRTPTSWKGWTLLEWEE